MNKRLVYIVMSILLLHISAGTAATPFDNNFSFRHYSVSEGLSSNGVRALAQDKYGFIWIGGDTGISRFDGVSMRKFNIGHSSLDNGVAALLDYGDSLWIGSFKGAYIFDYATEKLTTFDKATRKGVSITTQVPTITTDKDGNIWFSTMGQGVFRYSPRSGNLDQFALGSGGLVAQVFIDSRNQVWAVTSWDEPGLWLLDKSTAKFKPVTIKGLPNTAGLVMTETNDGSLWLGTWDCGLARIDRTHLTATICMDKQSPIYALHIHSMIEYSPGHIILGCDNGLIHYDIHNGTSHLYTKNELDPQSISGTFVYPLLRDHEGGLWIGTFYSGLNYVSPNNGRFESFAYSRFHNSVQGNVINRFCEDNNHNIWIASDDGGLNCYNPTTKQFSYYPINGSGQWNNNVHALCLDGDDLWIGTYTGGVNVMNTRTGAFRHYESVPGDETTLDGSSSYAIFKDSKGDIWVGTMDGINLYRRSTDDFERMKKVNAMTISIAEDQSGQLWFATQGNGLFRYNPKTRQWKQYNNVEDKKNDLPNNNVNCVMTAEDGTVWAATDCGLCRYDSKNDRFVTEEISEVMAVSAIIEDNNALWLTTNIGLVKYVKGEQIKIFDKNDGLQSNQFMPNAGMKASDGCIYIGSVNGFNSFFPYMIKENAVAPNVFITGLEVMNQPVAVGDDRLQESLNTLKELHLTYRDKMFSLSFASLSYCTPEKNQYAYWLEGFDKEWLYVGRQTKATYTNLSSGTYVFHVKGTNNDGTWSDKETTLTIVIHPPFYWTLPAKIIYTVIIVTLIVMAFRYSLLREKKRHERQIRKMKKEQEEEVRNSRIQFFTTVAHEIRTPVSLIIGPLESLIKTAAHLSPAEQNNLNIIDRNAHRLLDLVNQLLDFRKVEQNSFSMKFTIQNVRQLIYAVSERFEPTFAQNGVTFVTDYPDSSFTAILDREAITKVISNLLTNARKYTKDYVRLSCRIMPDDEHFAIEVTDNGTGISKQDHQRIFNAFYQAANNKPGTGIGLSIVKNIVDLHNGTVEVKSEPGHGATFIVTLPVKQIITPDNTNDGLISDSSQKTTDMPQNEQTDEKEMQRIADGSTVLIVDDSDDMLEFLKNNISRKYEVITAHDGIEALDKLRNNKISLIISDWMMPRMDGSELCRTVRADANTSHIPFVMLTAKTDNDSKTEGMNCGADAYIEKPFSMHYLEACCQNIMKLRQMLRRKYSSMPLEPITELAPTSVDNEFLVKMQGIIEDNFSNPDLTVNFLADKLCVSRSTLFAKLKTLADASPNEMIQLVRLKKSAQLMATGKYKINEVCYMVGFSNPSYFSKCFQKQFGVKPTEFVKSNEQQ